MELFNKPKKQVTEAEKIDYIYRYIKNQRKVRFYFWFFMIVTTFYSYYIFLNSFQAQDYGETLRRLLAPNNQLTPTVVPLQKNTDVGSASSMTGSENHKRVKNIRTNGN